MTEHAVLGPTYIPGLALGMRLKPRAPKKHVLARLSYLEWLLRHGDFKAACGGGANGFPGDFVVFVCRNNLVTHADKAVRQGSKQLLVDVAERAGSAAIEQYLTNLPKKARADLERRFQEAGVGPEASPSQLRQPPTKPQGRKKNTRSDANKDVADSQDAAHPQPLKTAAFSSRSQPSRQPEDGEDGQQHPALHQSRVQSGADRVDAAIRAAVQLERQTQGPTRSRNRDAGDEEDVAGLESDHMDEYSEPDRPSDRGTGRREGGRLEPPSFDDTGPLEEDIGEWREAYNNTGADPMDDFDDEDSVEKPFTCTFCLRHDPSFTPEELDHHYWASCPMLLVSTSHLH